MYDNTKSFEVFIPHYQQNKLNVQKFAEKIRTQHIHVLDLTLTIRKRNVIILTTTQPPIGTLRYTPSLVDKRNLATLSSVVVNFSMDGTPKALCGFSGTHNLLSSLYTWWWSLWAQLYFNNLVNNTTCQRATQRTNQRQVLPPHGGGGDTPSVFLTTHENVT